MIHPTGVKPVRFLLGAPDQLAQAQLFLGRASRELYTSEVLRGSHRCNADADCLDKVWRASRPADYLALAESKLVRPHGGNPRRILTAAQGLAFPTMALGGLRGIDQDYSKNTLEGDLSGGPVSPHRRVRILSPDGLETCEWLPVGMLISDVIKERSPKGCQDRIDIFVEGCLVQQSMSLAQFGDFRSHELLLVASFYKSGARWQDTDAIRQTSECSRL